MCLGGVVGVSVSLWSIYVILCLLCFPLGGGCYCFSMSVGVVHRQCKASAEAAHKARCSKHVFRMCCCFLSEDEVGRVGGVQSLFFCIPCL